MIKMLPPFRATLRALIAGILLFSCTNNQSPVTPAGSERNFTNPEIEKKISKLLAVMSLEEKLGQLNLRGTSSRSVAELDEVLKTAVRNGEVGSFLNIMNKDHREELQRIAVEESEHGIPLLFGRDVVHGFKTIFPIPLGQAASWNPELTKTGAEIAAREARSYGINWTFAPMMDISRDARWGRIAESFGEDPYLTSVMAVSSIEGFQGDFSGDHIAACAKHFVGYGAAEGGRDYNTAQIPEYLVREIYLPPFRASSKAGVATMMSAFNDISGVPASGNELTLSRILRQEWGFDGFVVSDWNSVVEMVDHGYAADNKDAALKGLTAGIDMEMMGTSYAAHLKELVNEGKIGMGLIDERVAAILRVKFKLGLFDDPGFDRKESGVILTPENKRAARAAAVESMVLLKNTAGLLPLDKTKKIALIGPLADAPHDQLGTWTFDGEEETSITPYMSLRELIGDKLTYVPGLEYSRSNDKSQFKAAIQAARKSDVIVFVGGEEAILSGEAHSRGNIDLPGKQEELIQQLKSTGKPLVLVIMAGRPVTLGNIIDYTDAILMAWHPGTIAGPALADLLLGMESPSGRLPVTWPKAVGQIPIYYNHYNTGRPATPEEYTHIDSIPVGVWQSSIGNTSHYLDLGYTPQYPFGYGLSYSTFTYGELALSAGQMPADGRIEISALVTNTGNRTAKEVVQLYTRDLAGDRVRPVRELKGFRKIELRAGESKTVTFTLHASDLAFWNQKMERVTEAGEFHVWIGPDASGGSIGKFEVTR
jgi:beta-glucosidase